MPIVQLEQGPLPTMAASSYDENGNKVDSEDESEGEAEDESESNNSDEVIKVFIFPILNCLVTHGLYGVMRPLVS